MPLNAATCPPPQASPSDDDRQPTDAESRALAERYNASVRSLVLRGRLWMAAFGALSFCSALGGAAAWSAVARMGASSCDLCPWVPALAIGMGAALLSLAPAVALSNVAKRSAQVATIAQLLFQSNHGHPPLGSLVALERAASDAARGAGLLGGLGVRQ